MVAVHNVMGAHVFQVHPLLLEELEGLIYILQAVNAHLSLRGLWLGDSIGSVGMEECHGHPRGNCSLGQLLSSAHTLHPPGQTPALTLTA